MADEPEVTDDYEAVIEAMRGGQTFQVGGGRLFVTYAMRDDRLVVIHTDDGYETEHPCDEATLRAAIAEVREGFLKIVAWWRAHRPAETPSAPSWPPTPSPPSSIDDAIATLRSNALGPPAFGDTDPWSFVFRWRDDVIAGLVWPAVSRLLEDDDAEVRDRALWFARTWAEERPRSLARLVEVATTRAELFRDPAQLDALAGALTDLSLSSPAENRRVASVLLGLLGDAPPGGGAVWPLLRHEPRLVIDRAPRWTESDRYTVLSAAKGIALYRTDYLLELLTALRSRSLEERTEVLAEITPTLALTDQQRIDVANVEGLPPPERPGPTLAQCRDALGLVSE